MEQTSVLGGECADSEKVTGQTSRSQFCAESQGVTKEAAVGHRAGWVELPVHTNSSKSRWAWEPPAQWTRGSQPCSKPSSSFCRQIEAKGRRARWGGVALLP